MAEITKENLQKKISDCDNLEATIDGMLNLVKQALYNRGARDMAKTLLSEMETADKPTETK
jgi:hypothetical protein